MSGMNETVVDNPVENMDKSVEHKRSSLYLLADLVSTIMEHMLVPNLGLCHCHIVDKFYHMDFDLLPICLLYHHMFDKLPDIYRYR